MRTEQEIREKLNQCQNVVGFGMSEGPCPFNDDGSEGCCAECTTMSTLEWVLGNDSSPNHNGQNALIDTIRDHENY